MHLVIESFLFSLYALVTIALSIIFIMLHQRRIILFFRYIYLFLAEKAIF